MIYTHKTPLMDQLFFSGAVSASLSHEINNVLAIIGELSGLIEDLSLAEGGIDPEKLITTLRRIAAQVERGKGHTKQLNTFSHSVEVTNARFDAIAATEEVVRLCERMARLKKVTLALQREDGELNLAGDLFDLQHLLFRQLQLAILGSTAGETIRVSARGVQDGVAFTCEVDSRNLSDEVSQVEAAVRGVAQKLGGTFDAKQEAGGTTQILVRLPYQLNRLRDT